MPYPNKELLVIAVLLLFAASASAFAQKLSVESLRLAENDLTARTEQRLDANKQSCALLKVQVRDQITEAQGNVVGTVIDKGGEKWVYFIDGTKQTNLLFRNYPPLSIYFPDHGIPSLRGNCTYVLTIAGESSANEQELTIRYTPADATVLVDDIIRTGKDGSVSIQVPLGEHRVVVAKNGYYSYRVRTEVIAEQPSFLNVTLEKEGTSGNVAQASSSTSKNELQNTSTPAMTAAEMYQKGKSYYDVKDYAEAVKWYRKAAEQGNASGQCDLGWMYQNGYGVTQDYAEALYWYRKAAEQGYARAQRGLGWMYQNGYGVTKDYAEAVKWYRKAADQGNASGQRDLGYMYSKGYGVEQDYAQAVKWYRKAAEQDYASAQRDLGYMYSSGYGVEQDYAEAVKWYRKSADQGSSVGQRDLGYMYLNGYGVKQDYAEAAKWYRKSAEQGNALGQRDLGWMYENGYGVPQNYEEALKWYRNSAEQGDAVGQFDLGVMYEHGYGVSKDLSLARYWYQKSADQGFQNAINALKQLSDNTVKKKDN